MPCGCCPGGISRSAWVPRYPSDMSDGEWKVIEPALPAPAWLAGKGGRCGERMTIRYHIRRGQPLPDIPPGPSRQRYG